MSSDNNQNDKEKVFVFNEPQSLQDLDLSCFCQKSNEKEASDAKLWLKIAESFSSFGNTSFSLQIHNGDNEPYFRYKGWTLVGHDSTIYQAWNIVLFSPTIIDPYGTLVEIGNSVNEPDIYISCYRTEDFREYLLTLIGRLFYIADHFVTAEHYHLYASQFVLENGNHFCSRMATINHLINTEWEADHPEVYRRWLDRMIKNCKTMLSSAIAPSIESGKYSIKEALIRYESARAKMR